MKNLFPSKILLYWFIGFPILLIIISIAAGSGHSGGEQVEFTTMAKGIGFYFAGSLLVIVSTCLFRFSWFRKNLLWLLLLFLAFAYLTFRYYFTE